jgi:hypothetical protein
MLIGVHFPKASGTSLFFALKKAFGDALYPDYAENPADPHSPRQRDPAGYFGRTPRVPEHIRCIYGHFHPNKYARTASTFRFTLLRHPVDTMLSIYAYWQTTPARDQLHRHVIENRLNVVETARLHILTRLMSHTYFGDVDMTSFDLIGRYDNRPASLAVISNTTGIPLDPGIAVNLTPDGETYRHLKADPAIRATLEGILHEDIRFYETYAFRDV